MVASMSGLKRRCVCGVLLRLRNIGTMAEGEESTIRRWKTEQDLLKSKIITKDTEMWQCTRQVATLHQHQQCLLNSDRVEMKDDWGSVLTNIVGMDISTLKSCDSNDCLAAVALVVCRLPDLKVVYSSCDVFHMTIPYITGLFSFREGPPLIKAFQAMRKNKPEIIPHVILIDGNGVLHPRGCGLACYVGATLDIPCIGVAKNLMHVDGISHGDEIKRKIKLMSTKGDTFQLIGDSGHILGTALKTCDKAQKPVYISVGHRISLETATWVVSLCSSGYRVPEPIRQADMISRERLRILFPEVKVSDTNCIDSSERGQHQS